MFHIFHFLQSYMVLEMQFPFREKLKSRQFQNGGLRSRFFVTNFLRIASISKVKTLVSGKDKRKKVSFLE